MTARIDLRLPSLKAAHHLAREKTFAHMREDGRVTPDREDQDLFAREFARLLWHVPVWQGGFCHGDDREVRAQAKRLGLRKHYASALHTMRDWPKFESAAR
jgi:hypothetical protein